MTPPPVLFKCPICNRPFTFHEGSIAHPLVPKHYVRQHQREYSHPLRDVVLRPVDVVCDMSGHPVPEEVSV